MPEILGQPTLEGYVVTVSLTCACETKPRLLISGVIGLIFGCTRCRRCWRLDRFQVRGGQVEVDLTPVLRPTDDA